MEGSSETTPLTAANEPVKRSFINGFWHSTKTLASGSKLNFLLLSVPIAILFDALDITSATFVFSLIGLIPLAERLGFVTEELATYTNDSLGGLLNATFGNATELIICGVSLYNAGSDHDKRYLRIVQLSLLGSVLGNLLLVMGTAFLVGGIFHPRQAFNQEGMGVNSGMLFMAVASIIFPSVLEFTGTEEHKNDSELNLSRFESILLLILYASFLIFQLVTHKYLYTEAASTEENPTASRSQAFMQKRSFAFRQNEGRREDLDDNITISPAILRNAKTKIFEEETSAGKSENDQEKQDEELGLGWCVIWLAVITVVIAVLSEMVVDTIEDAHDSLGIPMPFLSTIVLPLVGNAAEHASAILFAYKNRMEITLGVAVGSATQIAVFVIPFTVVLAWIMSQPLDLNFEWFEAFTLFLCTLITFVSVSGGTSNWIKGLILVVTYFFVSAAFWVHSDKDLKD
eukprot:g648.t1